MSNNLDSVKGKVEDILKNDPETRNDDKLLQIKVWAKDLELISKIINFKKLFSFTREDCKFLTNPHSIIRVRQFIQNEENRYIPTDPKVIVLRAKFKEKIEDWLRRSLYGTLDYPYTK